MHNTRLAMAILTLALAITVGCQATRKVGQKAGAAALALPFLVVEGMIDNLFGSDEETIFEKDRRERRERPWKQYWRDHPEENPAMHEAFKDDYQ